MDERKKVTGPGLAAGAVGILVLLAVIGLAVVYTGRFNVAATEEHGSFTQWAFDTTFRNSVRRNAAQLAAPETFTPAMIEAGAGEYKAMCEHCHAGPGLEADGWASGMRPQAARLTETAADWELEEVFWLVKHGVRMTGMPAFGPTHDDPTLWNIAAFVEQLPTMTPERYEALEPSDGEHSHDDHTH